MNSSTNMEDWKQTKLGPGLTVASWEAHQEKLRPESYDEDWETCIAGIEGRFTERFIKPAEAIQALDEAELNKSQAPAFPEGRGFAIVALDCLLLESLYGYERGKHTKNSGDTKTAFADLLTSKPQFSKAFEGLAASFAAAVRNGLLHDGETRDGWIIWRGRAGGPLVRHLSDGRLVLNRDPFHEAVKVCLSEYFDGLRADDSGARKRREAFRDRVDELCRESKPVPAPPPAT